MTIIEKLNELDTKSFNNDEKIINIIRSPTKNKYLNILPSILNIIVKTNTPTTESINPNISKPTNIFFFLSIFNQPPSI